MECTCKGETSKQSYEIYVCFNHPAVGITPYRRLRFALLVSTWVPKPLGMLLWSVLHVLLMVGGASLLGLAAAIRLVWPLLLDSIWFPHCIIVLCFYIVWGTPCFIWSLIRLSWSLIRESARLQQIRVACRRFAAWWTLSELDSMSDRHLWLELVGLVGLKFTRRSVTYIVQEWRPWRGALARWCEEVVHMHDAIVI